MTEGKRNIIAGLLKEFCYNISVFSVYTKLETDSRKSALGLVLIVVGTLALLV